MMFGKQTIVAVLMIVCCSVSVALADGGTIKGVAKWQGKAPSRKPIQVTGSGTKEPEAALDDASARVNDAYSKL